MRAVGPATRRARQIVLLLSGGATLGLLINVARGTSGVALLHPIHAAAEGGGAACAAPSASHALTSTQEAAALRGMGGVAFGDTRPADVYAEGHIAGAWHIPCFGSGNVAATSLWRLQGTRTLILYGQDEAQADAKMAAEELAHRGFGDVRLLAGGWRAWQSAGLPAESGPCDECRASQ